VTTVRVVIAGGHGKIARRLALELNRDGHLVESIIRNPEHEDAVRDLGARPVVLDLESASVADVAAVLEGADAAVFAAGAGPGSTAERKLTVDRDGAILLADAAASAGVRRLIVISAMGTDDFDAASDDVFQIYLRAKSEADAYVRDTDLDWTIVRPGGLTDDIHTGLVAIGDRVERGTIPRADVADLIVSLLERNAGIRRQFEVVSGPTPIGELAL
jgi:nucleoside-diphosphate-sugar epimerase